MNSSRRSTEHSKQADHPLADQLQTICPCREGGDSSKCDHRAVCSHWQELQQRTVRHSWVDRFLRAFVMTNIQGRIPLPDQTELPDDSLYTGILFTPQEGRRLLLELKEAIFSLHKRYSYPLALYLEGYTCREIAEILDLTMTAVLTRIGQARKTLLRLIRPAGLFPIDLDTPKNTNHIR